MRQGDEGSHVILLRTGMAKVVTVQESGDEALLALRFGGDLVGEMAVFDQQPRSATVMTCAPTVATSIHRREFSAFLDRHPDAAVQVSRMISERLRWANQRRLDYNTHDPQTRVARVLADLAESHDQRSNGHQDLLIPLNQQELASLAGAKLRIVQETLRKLEALGAIRRCYRKVEVVDLDSLRHVAKFFPDNPH